MTLKRSKLLLIILLASASITPMAGLLQAAEFGAYYTKIDSGEAFEKYSRTLPYADVVVRNIGTDGGRLVFWRGSSYLPYWEAGGEKWFFEELTERAGDGPAKRPDNVNTYSRARIVKSSADEVVVHWRYLPKFEGRNPHFNAVNIPFQRDKIGEKEPKQGRGDHRCESPYLPSERAIVC